jgi:hypothetical protein
LTHGFIQDADANILVELADNLAVHKAPQLLPAANTSKGSIKSVQEPGERGMGWCDNKEINQRESSHAK